MHAVVTPPHAPSMPSPNGVSPSVRLVALPPPHCALTSAATAVSPSHPMTSPQSSVHPHTPFPTSVSPLKISTPAGSMPEGPWHSFVARSTPTPSALSAAGNQTQCSGTYTPRPSHSSATMLTHGNFTLLPGTDVPSHVAPTLADP